MGTYGTGVAWMSFERLWMLTSSVTIGFLIVRAIGPIGFGKLSAATAVTAIFAGLSTMGLETVVIRRLTESRATQKSIALSACVIRIVASILYTLLCGAVAAALFFKSPEVTLMAVIIAAGTIFRSTDVVGLWLQVEDRYGSAARIRVFGRVAGDGMRIACILHHMPAIWFATAMFFEATVTGITFAASGGPLARTSGSFESLLNRSLLRDGLPVMLGAMMSAVYARVDQLVLYHIGGAAENGYYAAAARVSEAFNAVLLSVNTVAAAHFGRIRSAADAQVNRDLRAYFRFMVFLGLAISLTLCVFSGPIVRLIYGVRFTSTIPILRIHAWTVCLVCSSIGMEPWFYHYRKLRYYVSKTICALVFSIPAAIAGARFLGADGTAMAVVATYMISVFWSNAMIPGARSALRFQLDAFRRRPVA